MVPPDPVAHLIAREPGVALAALEALLNAMLRLRDSRQFHERHLDSAGVSQVIVVLVAAITL